MSAKKNTSVPRPLRLPLAEVALRAAARDYADVADTDEGKEEAAWKTLRHTALQYAAYANAKGGA